MNIENLDIANDLIFNIKERQACIFKMEKHDSHVQEIAQFLVQRFHATPTKATEMASYCCKEMHEDSVNKLENLKEALKKL